MNDDLSNKAIFVLVILTVVISIFSTFLLMSVSSNNDVQVTTPRGDTSGKVTFSIKEPAEPDMATGKVTFRIIDN